MMLHNILKRFPSSAACDQTQQRYAPLNDQFVAVQRQVRITVLWNLPKIHGDHASESLQVSPRLF